VQPFDPVALVAMLTTFYPVVSVAALRLARSERPEYFGAGVLGGSKGDKLTLPDGRVWDLIFAAGAAPGVQRWQAIEATGADGGAGEPWPLEPGPLTPLDAFPVRPRSAATFEALVTEELGALEGRDEQLAAAGQAVADFDGAGALNDAASQLLDPAIEAHAHTRGTIDADDMGDELDAANNTSGAIDAARNEYDEDPPEDVPTHDPGDPPRDNPDDEEHHPPREAPDR
jgi:hypothetical protein